MSGVLQGLVLRERGRKAKCTCRRDIKDCPFWGPLFASPATLDGMSHTELALTQVAQNGGAHDVLVDSSKTAWRSIGVPFRLPRELGQDFKLVHLVRDPRAVSWSAVKKAKRRGARPLLAMRCALAAAGWWIANLGCERFGQNYPSRYLRLRQAAAGVGVARRRDRRKQYEAPALWQPHARGEPVACRGEGGRWLAARHAGQRSRARRAAHRFAPLAVWLRLREHRGSLWRWWLGVTRNEEVRHASQVSSATKGRPVRRSPPSEARPA